MSRRSSGELGIVWLLFHTLVLLISPCPALCAPPRLSLPGSALRSVIEPTRLSKNPLSRASPPTARPALPSGELLHCVACSATEALVMLPGTRAAGLCRY
jgi:hypothetical protein